MNTYESPLAEFIFIDMADIMTESSNEQGEAGGDSEWETESFDEMMGKPY